MWVCVLVLDHLKISYVFLFDNFEVSHNFNMLGYKLKIVLMLHLMWESHILCGNRSLKKFVLLLMFFPVEYKTRNNTETAWNSYLNLFNDNTQ
jgi:hypothetical protein